MDHNELSKVSCQTVWHVPSYQQVKISFQDHLAPGIFMSIFHLSRPCSNKRVNTSAQVDKSDIYGTNIKTLKWLAQTILQRV